MKILIATPEAVPYAKTGGLADVTGALLKALRLRGVDASLVLPLYGSSRKTAPLRSVGKSFTVVMGGQPFEASIWTSEKSSRPQAYFIECEPLFGRSELYGLAEGDYDDNALRFAFFSRAVLEMCCAMDIRPDVIHCNEWQTAMIPVYLRKFYEDRCSLNATAVLFTVHNLGYQGIFPPSDLGVTGLGADYLVPDRLEFYGKINFMKGGLIFADLINTVSPSYAREILGREYGFGLEGVLRQRREDLSGVINCVDYGEWNPAEDPLIPARYTTDDLGGKRKCKKALLAEVGLSDTRRPLLGVVSRLSSQKGLDLLVDAVDELIALGANVALVGKGEDHYQRLLKDMGARHSGRVFVRIGFEERIAHLIYAASDFFLMPSRYEPCGIGQLIAMRYGAIPIARKTGGLADTVEEYELSTGKGTGFLFSEYSAAALLAAVRRALEVFRDKKKMHRIIAAAMKADFSAGRSAGEYLELYRKAVERVKK
jgi:starch synthase